MGIVALAIAIIAAAHYGLRLNAVFAFWAAYILTRPLGASIGDGMSQPATNGVLVTPAADASALGKPGGFGVCPPGRHEG